jgi:NAD(P)-dependent dehydrogenase (short-subunit alcohol dehydrogenase family)
MDGRVVVITGASSGVGAVLARRVAVLGGRPVLAARRTAELNEVAAACGPESLAVPADVTVRSEVERVRDLALERFGAIDAWINNAGRGITRPVSALTDEDVDEMVRVNLKSALYGMQAVLPHFQSRGRGHIVNVSSMLSRIPYASFRSAYTASKAALNMLTANLRMELRATHPGIHVTTVLPGVVATEFGLRALGGGPDSRALANSQPAEEVAEVIVGVLRAPRAEVYTRPGMREQAAAYYAAEDLGEFEARLPGVPPVSPPRP